MSHNSPPLNEPKDSTINRGGVSQALSILEPWQKLIVILAAIIGFVFFIYQYFAKQSDLDVMKCKFEAEERASELQKGLERETPVLKDMQSETDRSKNKGEAMQLRSDEATLQQQINSEYVEEMKEETMAKSDNCLGLSEAERSK